MADVTVWHESGWIRTSKVDIHCVKGIDLNWLRFSPFVWCRTFSSVVHIHLNIQLSLNWLSVIIIWYLYIFKIKMSLLLISRVWHKRLFFFLKVAQTEIMAHDNDSMMIFEKNLMYLFDKTIPYDFLSFI